MSDKFRSYTLKVWRQKQGDSNGKFETYSVDSISADLSFLEMIDCVNEDLILKGKDPIAIDSDCREGICGTCGAVVNGQAHGPLARTALCQLHMRYFPDGQVIVIEPWRAESFPIVKDLVVDRSSFDRIIQSGGYISSHTGSAPDANSHLVGQDETEEAIDMASCIGCGACVAACPNASAMLFTAAKISHLSLLPQGQPEKQKRAKNMLKKMEEEGFGHCSNLAQCEAVCPKGISVKSIALLNRDIFL